MVQRVLMTADAVGGVWRYSLDLAGALATRGVTTTLVVMGPAPTGSQRQDAARVGVRVIDCPHRLEWMEDADEDVRAAGRCLLDLATRLHPDIVHLNGYVHAAMPWSSPTVVVAHSCVRSWWRAVHGDTVPDRYYDRYTRGVIAGLRAATAVAAPSEAMGQALSDEYAVPRRARVIPNGCAAPVADLTECLQHKEPIVLAAGRVWDVAKNIGSLCAVAWNVAWPIYVAGEVCAPDGTTAELSAVRTLGRLSCEQMDTWYQRAAIYALPARYEPFGLSVLEAARAGCALVLGDIPSLRENWSGAALFVPPDDRLALAAAIQQLIDRPDLRVDMARRAACRSARFTLDRMADDYLRLYESLVA